MFILVEVEKGLCLEVRPLPLPTFEEEKISAIDLYNVLNNVSRTSSHLHDPLYALLLDTRSMADYTYQHIQSAFHCSALKASVINSKLKHFTHIIVYGSGDDDEADIEQSEKTLTILSQAKVPFVVLQGGYTEFSHRFPFMCNETAVWAETERVRKLQIYPSLILEDWLYQGSGTQATDEKVIAQCGITHILNISTEHHCTIDGMEYLNIQLADDGKSKISNHFVDMVKFISSAKSVGGKILVHCNLGVSRSSTATLAYMMFSNHCSLLDAFKLLRMRRPISSPNKGFLYQLADFEYYLFGEHLTDAHELWLAV